MVGLHSRASERSEGEYCMQNHSGVRAGVQNNQGEGDSAAREESQQQGEEEDQGQDDRRCEYYSDPRLDVVYLK